MLEQLGLKKRESGIYTIELNDGFLGWLGLPSAVKKGVIAISPVVGIRHQATHALLSEIMNGADHLYLPPTISKGLGFLLPEKKWREWYFDTTDDVYSYQSLVDEISDVALPFMRDNASLLALESMLEEYEYVRFKMDQHERLPVVKFLSGNIDGARSKLEEYIGEVGDSDNPRSVAYKTIYAQSLSILIDEKTSS
jgi:hypothetical protein